MQLMGGGLGLFNPFTPGSAIWPNSYSLRTANFSRVKAFGILIDLKGYAHYIFLLLTESLIMMPPGKRQSTLSFPVKVNFSRA